MRILLAAGGTGGHLIPAIRISEAISRVEQKAEFVFVGSDKGFEEQVITQRNKRYVGLTARGLSRRRIWRNIPAVYHNWRARKTAADLVQSFKPSVAVGCGGYASYFPIRSCCHFRIPYILQEQNETPGLATRWLATQAATVFIAFEETRARLPRSAKAECVGNPIDPRLSTLSRDEARRLWDLPSGARVILVTGGSSGARSINSSAVRSLRVPNDSGDVHVLWQTGAQGSEWDKQTARGWHVRAFTFTDKMTEAFVAADLIVARAGALTISEICAAGRPAILVPYPLATADHQTRNAQVLVDAGGAIHLPDWKLDRELILAEALTLLNDPVRMHQMALSNRQLGKPGAADQIAARVIELAGKHV